MYEPPRVSKGVLEPALREKRRPATLSVGKDQWYGKLEGNAMGRY